MKVSLKRKDKAALEMNAVRKCSQDCYFFRNGGAGCAYYQEKNVKFGESCLHDMMHLKNYADAFATGDLDFVKKDASEVTAMLIMQIRRMLEQVNIEGVTIDEPMLDAKGQPIWIPDPNWRPEHGTKREMVVAMRKSDHPLIQRCIQLARSVGINLGDFKLTPKSADEKRSVGGHIIAENPATIEQVMADRKKIEDRFLEAVNKGTQMTIEDPVYQELLKSGEIVN